MTTIAAIISSLLLVFAAFPHPSHALMISGDPLASTEGLTNFTGSLTYTVTSPTAATLMVNLTNTTPAGGGFITAFAFNNPGNTISNVTLGLSTISPGSPTFNFATLLGGSGFNNGVSAPPFGDFDIGLTTNGNWLAGGNENKGIPVTQTGIFGFSLFGSNLTTLDEASFVSELSNNPGGGGAQFFAVRFRGITIGAGSDKVPAAGGPETPIPEPGTLLLIGSGLVGLGAGAWRRKKH